MFIYLTVCVCLFIHSVIHSFTWDSLTLYPKACLNFSITQAGLELTVDPVVIASFSNCWKGKCELPH